MLLYCVRHGETESNAQGRIQGQLDTLLSATGQRQAQRLAAAFAKLPVDAIFSSPLRRALDTARVIADALRLEVEVEPLLMEINAGVFGGLRWDEIDHAHPDAARRWRSHDPDFRIPGGESRRDLMHRALRALQVIRGRGFQQAAVVSHGGLLSAGFKALLEIPAGRNPFNLQNGSISKLAWNDDVKLLTVNQVDHLGEDLSGGGDL